METREEGVGYYDKNSNWIEGELPEQGPINPNEELIENAKIIHPMDEILKNNDKFETIRVIMEILCRELEISIESQFPAIAAKLIEVSQNYYKSMEDYKNLMKTGQKQDIRQ